MCIRDSAIDAYIDGLNGRRGAVFSSNYEFPGRYTRWDTAGCSFTQLTLPTREVGENLVGVGYFKKTQTDVSRGGESG